MVVKINSPCRKKAVVCDQLPHLGSLSLKWAATPGFIVEAGRGFAPVLCANGGNTPDGGRQPEGGFGFVCRIRVPFVAMGSTLPVWCTASWAPQWYQVVIRRTMSDMGRMNILTIPFFAVLTSAFRLCPSALSMH